MTATRRASAPGKLVLLGEYAVLHGAQALVVAVDRRVSVTLTERMAPSTLTSAELEISAHAFGSAANGEISFVPQMPPEKQARLRLFSDVYREASVLVERKLPSAAIQIDSSAFMHGDAKLGLGSSAAVAAGLFAALTVESGSLSRREIFAHVFAAHRRAQGERGSGIDVAASVYGGCLLYRLKPELSFTEASMQPQSTNLAWPNELHWVAVYTGRATRTADMLSALDVFRQHNAQTYESLMSALSDASDAGVAAFSRGDTGAFCRAVHRYYQGLVTLSQHSGVPVVSDTHQRLAHLVSKFSAVYKPSGAGDGDMGVAFCSTTEQASLIATELTLGGWQVVPLAIDAVGVTVGS